MSSIIINTSEYTNTKDVEIDGHKLKMRPMSSAETIAISNTIKKIEAFSENKSAEGVSEAMEEISKICFNVYDDPKMAKQLLGNLPVKSLFDIYNKVFGVNNNG